MAWKSPDSTNDPMGTWNNEGNIMDENTATRADCTVAAKSWSNYLEALVAAPIFCDKVRFWVEYGAFRISKLSLDVFYGAAWHNIFEGAFADKTWVEKTIPAGSQMVSKLRAKFYNTSTTNWWPEWYETDFNELPAPPSKRMGVCRRPYVWD